MPALIDLSSLGSLGFIVQGAATGDHAGFSVSSAGDVNGDGLTTFSSARTSPMVAAAMRAKPMSFSAHRLASPTVDLATLAPIQGFVIQGGAAGNQAGWSVASAGDINGDGFDDLIVGEPYGDNGGTNAGEAYVIFGKSAGFATIDLAALAAADGFIIQGDAADDWAAGSVSSAGDVNGDGYDDIVIGARGGNDGGTDAGEAYVIFGKSAGFANIDLAALAPADGFVIQGVPAADTGWSVSSAGDVNGDGYDDVIVGAPAGDDGGAFAGEAYVIFGKSAGFATVRPRRPSLRPTASSSRAMPLATRRV